MILVNVWTVHLRERLCQKLLGQIFKQVSWMTNTVLAILNFKDDSDLHNTHSIFENGLDASRISILQFNLFLNFFPITEIHFARLNFSVSSAASPSSFPVKTVDSTDNGSWWDYWNDVKYSEDKLSSQARKLLMWTVYFLVNDKDCLLFNEINFLMKCVIE